MPEVNSRTVDGGPLVPAVIRAPPPGLEHRQNLGSEGFVELDQIDVVPDQARVREQPLDRGHGADAHARGITAGGRPSNKPGGRLAIELDQPIFGHAETSRCRVIKLGRSEEHTPDHQSQMSSSYAVCSWKKNK